MIFKFFSDPKLIRQVDGTVMNRLLDDYRHCLPPAAAALIGAPLDFDQYCAAWSAQFKSLDGFGAPLVDALTAIETLSLPQNAPLLEQARATLPPGYDLRAHRSSLHQCTHLWIICQNTPGVTWPLPLSPTLSPTLSQPLAPSSNGDPPSDGSPLPGERGRGEGESVVRVHGDVNSDAAPSSTIHHPSSPAAAPAPRSDAPPGPNASDDFVRLACLSPTEYDQVRRAEAKRLGLRLRTLDDAVERAGLLLADAEADEFNLSKIEPWPEPITDACALFDEVHSRFLMYMYLPPGAAFALTLWPAHAHAISAFTRTPRLNFTSAEPGCGKTTCIELLSTLCPNFLCTNSLKPAVLYRILHKGQVTVALDELDLYLQLQPELHALLNAGNNPGACVHRCEGRGVRAFKVFGPIILSGLGHLPRTLRDRSIIINLTNAPAGALQARFDLDHADAEKVLGRKIARWSHDNFDRIAACDPVMPPAAYNRLGDNWRPLFAIAQIIGAAWPQRVLDSFTALSRRSEAQADSSSKPSSSSPPQSKIENQKSKIPVNHYLHPSELKLLLADIRSMFAKSNATRLFSSTLVESLRALPNRPWSSSIEHPASSIEHPSSTIHPPSSAALTPTTLAQYLRPLGIGPRNQRIGGARAKGYHLADFSDAFTTFLNTNNPT